MHLGRPANQRSAHRQEIKFHAQCHEWNRNQMVYSISEHKTQSYARTVYCGDASRPSSDMLVDAHHKKLEMQTKSDLWLQQLVFCRRLLESLWGGVGGTLSTITQLPVVKTHRQNLSSTPFGVESQYRALSMNWVGEYYWITSENIMSGFLLC